MSQRAQRVAELIKQEVSQLLQRGIKDPRVGFVTVTDVEVTGDLRNAKIFVSVFGDDRQKMDSMEGLRAATGFIRREVGKYLRLRHTPDLTFRFDDSVQYGAHINNILADIKRTDDSEPTGENSEEYLENDEEDEQDEYTEGDR